MQSRADTFLRHICDLRLNDTCSQLVTDDVSRASSHKETDEHESAPNLRALLFFRGELGSSSTPRPASRCWALSPKWASTYVTGAALGLHTTCSYSQSNVQIHLAHQQTAKGAKLHWD